MTASWSGNSPLFRDTTGTSGGVPETARQRVSLVRYGQHYRQTYLRTAFWQPVHQYASCRPTLSKVGYLAAVKEETQNARRQKVEANFTFPACDLLAANRIHSTTRLLAALSSAEFPSIAVHVRE